MARNKIKSATDQRRFTLVYNDFLESNILNYYEKMVFIVLKKYADNETMRSFPSLKTIQKATGISLSQVRRSIEHMEQLGVIAVEHRNDKEKGHQSNVYTLFDYAEMWKVDSGAEDIAEITEGVNEAKMIAMLREKGYKIIKEKEPETSQADQSNDESSAKFVHIYENNNISKEQKSQAIERYTIEDIKVLYDYDVMVEREKAYKEDIDNVISILYDALNCTKPFIRIAGEDKPTMVVVSKLLKLDYDSITYAIEKYREQTERIKNPIQYMLTILYRASEQFFLDIKNQVKHDMSKN